MDPMGHPMDPASCAICRLHGDAASAAFEIARSDLWLLRHHPDPAPLAGWLLLDARRHLAGPLAFTDREATSWGRAVRHASQLVQQLTGCDRVYAIAFGEGAPHLQAQQQAAALGLRLQLGQAWPPVGRGRGGSRVHGW
jgi:hypothetical protein